MPECSVCGLEFDHVTKCKTCGERFCFECGSIDVKQCLYCLEEDDYEQQNYDDDDGWG